MFYYLIIFILAAVLAMLLTPLAIILAGKWGIIDYPGDRRIHTFPIPRLGGAAIFLAFWLTIFLLIDFDQMILGLFLGSSIIFLVGMVDDIKGLRPLVKLLWQLVAAIVPLFFGLAVEQVTLPILGEIYLGMAIGYAFAVIWIVGVVNTVNISDGLDGLAAGICFIAALILCWSALRIDQVIPAYLLLALAGVALGFLFYNYHPAKIFMGDSGSMFLGYILGAVSIWGLLKTATILGLVFPLLVLGMPITDVLFAIIRRSWKGLSIARADRGHLHHRLLDAGFSQKQAVLILYAISLCFGLAAILSVYGYWLVSLILILLNTGLILRIMLRRFFLLNNNNKIRKSNEKRGKK
ncbi:MAG TPA: undecaprenyl/decaprenyl-phosphate alpha-N-acetylglucosaminyl 1-phosphate transferase [Peptococcaceae bacterium]|nr:undecaprenyl/decaprenyl-phosphate alpha-N-acetylglucosaminyl 1-phosphate transferase [Peptococcaceae bacterium]